MGRIPPHVAADHPRIRGEHISCSRFVPAIMGSSPHTRGAPHRVGGDEVGDGIIPAYAGSTTVPFLESFQFTDHPRIRGEHVVPLVCDATRLGSSPHTRGAQLGGQPGSFGKGIIPAYAGSTRRHHAIRGASSDHPRIRGEHSQAAAIEAAAPGSSPHTRGALSLPRRPAAVDGIIPAYAGSTSAAYGTASRAADHPRIRGEHPASRGCRTGLIGSSPHTRGALPDSHFIPGMDRIIPAYAGSTAFLMRISIELKDHPRIRGEHASVANRMSPVLGSSPHTRGALMFWTGGETERGIIPAYAGSTRPTRWMAKRWPDHPRIRGEHAPGARARRQRQGSSPHTRGAPKNVFKAIEQTRIIPAYAGSTGRYFLGVPPDGDHPRIRGEHAFHSFTTSYGPGSSPHTRGARAAHLAFRRDCGIIPAYAGSTVTPSTGSVTNTDHPRIRGEHAGAPAGFAIVRGSSPHTRGAQMRVEGENHQPGIIPAYAGSTSRM